jgi:predicted nucleic acid-binding protein
MSARQVLLDTSVVIAPPKSGLASIADEVAVSAISVAELEYGVGAAADPVERQRRRRRLQLVVEAMEVIPFDIASAESYGMLANMIRVGGRNPRPRRLDLLIAATAERHGLSLATRNADDFALIDRVVHVIDVR